MKKLLLTTTIILALSFSAFSQLGQSIDYIVSTYGDDYEIKYNYEYDLKYYEYKNIHNIASITTFYFDIGGNECIMIFDHFHIKSLNSMISILNDKNYVKKNELEWIDYSKNIVYEIIIYYEDEIFTLLKYYKK